MRPSVTDMTADDKLVQATDWLNEKLYPILGPPPLGPYDDDTADRIRHERGDEPCPICGKPMRDHRTVADPADGRTWLRCPDGPEGQELEAGGES